MGNRNRFQWADDDVEFLPPAEPGEQDQAPPEPQAPEQSEPPASKPPPPSSR